MTNRKNRSRKMLEALKFVKGAIAAKNHVPILKHFRIQDGRIQSYNGNLNLSAPIACDLNVQPLAETFVHAISLCDETVSMHLTATGRLVVKSGTFKAYINTSEEMFPEIQSSGELIDVVNLLDAIKILAPVMSEDASRPWSRGILFAGSSAYVTNNVLLVEHWLKHPVRQPFGLPAMAVNELLRINEEPEGVEINPNTVTFYFEGGRQLSTNLLRINDWPDIRQLLETGTEDTLYDIDPSLFDALRKLRPFTKDFRPVWLEDHLVSTSHDPEEGAHLELPDCQGMQGTWSLEQLQKLEGLANRIAWERAPKPCPFFGEVIRGVIIGIVSAHR
jgi:DNA polymerase III sliding clamp (beta) subunit (PCNA family)